MFTGQEIMDSDREDRNAEGRRTQEQDKEMMKKNGETAAVFCIYDVFGLRMAV